MVFGVRACYSCVESLWKVVYVYFSLMCMNVWVGG